MASKPSQHASAESTISHPPGEDGKNPEKNPAKEGLWGTVFELPNVAIHTHVLPTGKVLFWGRRDKPNGSLNEEGCKPYVWDPSTNKTTLIPEPTRPDGKTPVNLFCSGHAFLPDGRLLVAGGHIKDNNGLDQACIYDCNKNTWTALPKMPKGGRWYPTVTALPDGRMLVSSGSYISSDGKTTMNGVPLIWDGKQWTPTASFENPPLFPCMHVAPDGQVFMSGPNAQTYLLNTEEEGTWTKLPGKGGIRQNGQRDYAPSVMYDAGKVIYIGGGNPPTHAAEVIDLGENPETPPAWRLTTSMHFARRQHNATILADGTVLVTGGTRGDGFNNLDKDNPVHTAELWNPATGEWKELAAEEVDRCYHSTAVLLPDATVLSAGGGEFAEPDGITPNSPKDTHRDAQVFQPPYLFQADIRPAERPQIISAPKIDYGQEFQLTTSGPAIGRVTLIRLSSVTHSFNQNQLINVLKFKPASEGGSLTVTAPERPNICPPGHYMLFVISKTGVPSHARIVQIGSPVPSISPPVPPGFAVYTTEERDEVVRTQSTGTRVTIGLTSNCPYGLGACWGGAYEALTKLNNVATVRPIANAEDSTAEVYLRDQGLPDLDNWPQQFADWANASYVFRGVEVTVTGTIREQDGIVRLTGPSFDSPVTLMPLEQGVKVQLDSRTRDVEDATSDERDAYQHLVGKYQDLRGGNEPTRVTGPLTKTSAGWVLHVRQSDDAVNH